MATTRRDGGDNVGKGGGPRRGAFVDTRGVRWDPNDADYEGILYKQSRWMKEWRSRYFILKGSKLFYSKSATAAPHGVIDLVDCLSTKPADQKTKKKNSFEISTTDETHYLYSNSEDEKDSWVAAIRRAILKHSMVSDQEYLESDSEGSRSSDGVNSNHNPEQISS